MILGWFSLEPSLDAFCSLSIFLVKASVYYSDNFREAVDTKKMGSMTFDRACNDTSTQIFIESSDMALQW